VIDPSLAALSNTLFTVAVVLYSVAVVCFCAQLAFGRRPTRVRTRQLVTTDGAAVDELDAAPAVGADAEPESGRRWGLLAMGLTVLGVVSHLGILVTRGLATGRLPWGNMYEFATAAVLVATVAYVVLAIRAPGLRHIGAFVIGPVVLAMILIGLFLYTTAGPIR